VATTLEGSGALDFNQWGLSTSKPPSRAPSIWKHESLLLGSPSGGDANALLETTAEEPAADANVALLDDLLSGENQEDNSWAQPVAKKAKKGKKGKK